MKLGIEVLLGNKGRLSKLSGRRIGAVCLPASVDRGLKHTIDHLSEHSQIDLTCAFGPQHGMKGEKQYNMEETLDETDPRLGIPVFSLYSKVRRPTPEMMDHFDVLLFDLQDVGCRIYTYLATMIYLIEDCAKNNKALWVLDRPNPIGRPVEGLILEEEWKSFVGSCEIPMRHGMTLGELAQWYIARNNISLEFEMVPMEGYSMESEPGWGWPLHELSWVNPSPNIATLSASRIYPGSVMLEGTHLSEGRGTTRPLELLGHPDLDFEKIFKRAIKDRPNWFEGCSVRECYFQPTFYKHENALCKGLQVHVDHHRYRHDQFKPYRVFSALLKALKVEYPDFELWRDFPYEYEFERLPIHLIHGTEFFKNWVDDSSSTYDDLEKKLDSDEKSWLEERKDFCIY